MLGFEVSRFPLVVIKAERGGGSCEVDAVCAGFSAEAKVEMVAGLPYWKRRKENLRGHRKPPLPEKKRKKISTPIGNRKRRKENLDPYRKPDYSE